MALVSESSAGGDRDGDLLQRARAGDRDAISALCIRYRTPLVRFCYRYLGNEDAAEDAAQDVLARVAVDQRWPDSSFRAWIYRVARNHCLNGRRAMHNRPVAFGSSFGPSDIAALQIGPGTAIDRREREDGLRAALAALPHALAETLTLRYFQGLGRREIAEVLEVPEGVVKQRLAQARKELARKLGRDEAP